MSIKETIKWIESHSDADDRARALRKSCLLDETDPQIAGLMDHGATGAGQSSKLLKAMVVRPIKTTAAERAKRRVFERIRKHYPQMQSMPIAPAPTYDEPKTYRSDDDFLGPQLPIVPCKGWETKQQEGARRTISFNPPAWDIEYVTSQGVVKQVNPFRADPPAPRPLRSSLLTCAEVWKLYDGMSFAMWRHSVTMNVHVIIIWSMMGIDEVEGARRLGKYLNEATKWMRVGIEPRNRRVNNPRDGAELHYAWSHENTPGRGFHSHVLMNVPVRLIEDFKAWSVKCLVRHHGANYHDDAFRLVKSYAKTEDAAVHRHWHWFKYITKELDPGAQVRTKKHYHGKQDHALRDLLKPWPLRNAVPVHQMKMTGTSHSIGKKSQKDAGFKSMLSKARLDELFGGNELFDRKRLNYMRSLSVDDWSDYWE
jgi:hypothetical protein